MQLKAFVVPCLLLASVGAGKHANGKAFERFITIWLENTDSTASVADPHMAALAKQGIKLTNYFAITHPSEPNYVAAVGGEYFGMNNDNLNNIPPNVSSIVDLLEDKCISWGEYQEDLPSTGFTGFNFTNPTTGANDYVRKHNPLIIYDSVTNVPARSANIKNFTLLEQDVMHNEVPQWSFITPNMTNDGHDTNITFAGAWASGFLTPLLKNPNFNSDGTLILLTFDETGTDSEPNRVDAILLGGAVPKSLIGTTDNTFYTHYSEIATVEANWGLHTLGRYDVGANVFKFVADKTGDTIRSLDISTVHLNGSYPGVFNSQPTGTLPIPNTNLVVNGRSVLPATRKTWGSPALQKCTVYSGALLPNDYQNPPVLPPGC